MHSRPYLKSVNLPCVSFSLKVVLTQPENHPHCPQNRHSPSTCIHLALDFSLLCRFPCLRSSSGPVLLIDPGAAGACGISYPHAPCHQHAGEQVKAYCSKRQCLAHSSWKTKTLSNRRFDLESLPWAKFFFTVGSSSHTPHCVCHTRQSGFSNVPRDLFVVTRQVSSFPTFVAITLISVLQRPQPVLNSRLDGLLTKP